MEQRVLKSKAIELRKQGKTYKEICTLLGVDIPKSTMAEWFRGVPFSLSLVSEFKQRNLLHLSAVQKVAQKTIGEKRARYLQDLIADNILLLNLLTKKEVSKIALAMLYLGEGGKSGSKVSFSNSNPKVIQLYLRLLGKCYDLEFSKFRVTIQCRNDQDIKLLELFWQKVTEIPMTQFYRTRVDSRTVGVKTIKTDYKGVCRIDYFSSLVFDDIIQTIKVLYAGP